MTAESLLSPPLVPDAGPLQVNAALVQDLGRIVGTAHVSADPRERRRASRDMWPKSFLWEREGKVPQPPELVVWPGSVEEVSEVVRFAKDRAIPLTPYGAGSGVCGGAIPVMGGITMRFERMRQILRIDREALLVEAQAGVLGVDLEEALGRRGLTLGHFPSSIGCSSLGGWLAARSAGQSSSRYGKIEDMVLGLSCVLGSGEIVRPTRPAKGVDRIELLLGNEGTLGIFTDAALRLWPAPQLQLPRGYRFRSLEAGISAMEAIFREGLRPSVARLYDPIDTLIALGHRDRRESSAEGSRTRPPPGVDELRPSFTKGGGGRIQDLLLDLALGQSALLNGAAALASASLLVLIHEGARGEAEPEAAEAAEICEAMGGRALGEGPGRRWLRERYSVSYKLPKVFESGAWVDTFEVATSWGKLEQLFHAVRDAVAPHALVMAHFSHAYPDGCSIYFTFTGRAARVAEGIASYDGAWRAALAAAAGAGATFTHHHGVGLFKGPWLEEEMGEGGMSLLRGLKRSYDPAGILNPGKLGLAPASSGAFAAGREEAAWIDGLADRHRVGGHDTVIAGPMDGSAGRGGSQLDSDPRVLEGIDPVDPDSMWIRAFAGARVDEVEARLVRSGLTLGSQPPSVLRGKVADWLEGSFAGRRVEDGRLGPGIASVEAALPNGFLFVSRAAPRSAAGPAVEQLFLGGGGHAGRLIAATLKASPIPKETVRLGLFGEAAPLARLMVLLTQTLDPPLEIAFSARAAAADPSPGEDLSRSDKPPSADRSLGEGSAPSDEPPAAAGSLQATFSLASGSPRREAAIGRALAAARALGLTSCEAEAKTLERAPGASERAAPTKARSALSPALRAEGSLARAPPPAPRERELTPNEWIFALEALRPGMRLRFCRIARESAIAVEEG